MRPGRLARLVAQNVARARGTFLLGAFGIAVGVAALTFLLALSGGVSRVLLGKIFPVERLEVVQRKASFGPLSLLGVGGPARLTDDVAARLRARPEVRAAYPRMKVAFPARIWGGARFFGQDLQTEFVGDGVDPSLIGPGTTGRFEFRDLETPGPACAGDGDCGAGQYCPADLGTCQHPVPVLVSRYLVEIYNGQIARSHNLPQLSDFVMDRLRGFTFNVELGRSMITTAARGRPVVRRMRLVGVSDQAIPIGITVPLDYVRRWNRTYSGERQASDYTSIVVTVRTKRDVTPLTAWVKSLGFEQADRDAEQAGVAVTMMTALFGLLATVIISIAAINIAHTFFAQILERRRELALMRAVGGTRADLAVMVLGEATAVGLAGAATGLLASRGLAALADLAAARWLPSFPFKPDTFFAFTWPLLVAAVGFAVGFALLGAVWPALRAARLDPAASLSAP